MGRSPETDFAPKRLSRQSLETRVTPGMRLLPSEDREAMVERKLALEDRVSATGHISQGRVVRNVMIACIGMPVIGSFFAGAGYGTLWIQLPLAALLGVIVAYLQPSEFGTGLLFAAIGLLSLALTGRLHFGLYLVFAFFAYYGLGLLVGLDAWLRRTDGE